MSHPEGFGGERALRAVLSDFEGSDPEVPSVLALHVGAADHDGVPLDGLAVERGSFGGPVGEVAGFEVEIEGPPVFRLG